MSEIIELKKIDEVYLLVSCDKSQEMELKEHFSRYAPNYRYHPKYVAKIWSGKIYFFGRDHLLPIGLLREFLLFCNKFSYQCKFNFDVNELKEEVSNFVIDEFIAGLKQHYPSKFELMTHQYEAFKSCVRKKRGVSQIVTGGGKSFLMYNLIQYLRLQKRKILLLVPSVSLVEQMYSDFQSYGWSDISSRVTKLYSGQKPDFTKDLLISTWQSVYKFDVNFFEKYDSLLVDETHNLRGASLTDIAKKCKNCDYRLGFTGTLPTEPSELMTINGYLGDVIAVTKASELIDKGVLSQIKIMNVLMDYPDDIKLKNKNRSYNEELETIYNFPDRNKIIKNILDSKQNDNTLILCHLIDHLKQIEKYLVEHLDMSKYKLYIIYGEISAEEREKIRIKMDQESGVILLSSYGTMSTGVSIKKIHNIIFASSYRSKIKVLQSIGRGLRTHESKDKMILWDMVDCLVCKTRTGAFIKNHVYKHWEERLKYYKENGFEYKNATVKLNNL